MNPSMCDWECKKACKIDKYLDIKICSGKCLFVELLLTFKNEILNTIENSLVDKKVTCEKNNWFIHTILLIRMCLLLLVVICFNCYYYYTKHWIKRNMHSY